jgi:hypothetical protein
MCFNNENWSLNRLSYNIHNMVDDFKVCYIAISNVVQVDRFIVGTVVAILVPSLISMVVVSAPLLELVMLET